MSESTSLTTTEPELPEVAERLEPKAILTPAADILDTPDALLLEVDVPGCGEADVEVDLEDDLLTLKARPALGTPGDEWKPAVRGMTDGIYERRFRLAEAVDVDGIEATVKHGVLRVALPKKGNVTRKITVHAG